MAIKVMTIHPKTPNATVEGGSEEIAERLTVWLRDRPGTRVINIETLLVRDAQFTAAYEGEKQKQHIRVWLDVPNGACSNC